MHICIYLHIYMLDTLHASENPNVCLYTYIYTSNIYKQNVINPIYIYKLSFVFHLVFKNNKNKTIK